jgi:hypothetical protein
VVGAGGMVDVVVVGGWVVVDVVDVVEVVLDELVDVVVLVTGAVLEDVVGSVVGDALLQLTLTTVRLTLVESRASPSQPTGVIVPTDTVMAPAGTAAAGAGATESRPDTAALTRDPVQVRSCAAPAEAGRITSPVRMSPFATTRPPREPAGGCSRARRPWIPALDTNTAP